MKKINFLSSTKLLMATIGLIIGAFTLLSMSFPYDPAYTGPNVNGPKMAHWTTSKSNGCGTTTTYHNTADYAESKAVTTGNGSVSVSGTNPNSNAKTGESVQESGSNANDEVVLTWNCGYKDTDQTTTDNGDTDLAIKHQNTVTFTANPNPGYQFLEWKDNGGTQLSTANPCDATFDMGISNYAANESSATKYPSTSPYKSKVYYAYFTPITVTAPVSVERVQAYMGDLAEGTIVFTLSTEEATTADFNTPSFTATTAGTWEVSTWFVQDGEITANYRFLPDAQGVYDSEVTLTVTSVAGESANVTIPVTVNAAATKYYSQLTAKLSSKSAYDGGEIWASKTEGMLGVDWSTSDQVLSHAAYSNTEPITYYMHAQSKEPNKYVFVGWYRTDACGLGDLLSVSPDYSVDITPTSTDADAPTAQTVYARFIRLSEHYLEVTALPHKVGLGMVYASEEAGADQVYSLYSPSGSQAMCEVMSTSTAAVNGTIYVHAYPKYGYKFDGWFTNAECTGAAVSTNAHYAYSTEAVSTDPVVPTKKTLYAKFSMATPINVTFNYPANGTYTACVRDVVVEDGEYVWGEVQVYNSAEQTANFTQQIYPTSSIKLTATPNVGMAVKSWTDGSSTVKSGSVNYTTTATTAKTLGVTMGTASPFKVESTTYADLHDAITAAGSTKTIIVVEDCWIPNGTYTIPSGVTLLIPDAEDNTKLKTSPTLIKDGKTAPTPFRCVELAPEANIILKGNLGLSGTQSGVSSGNPGAGAVIGNYGCLDMSKGGSITIQSGGKLYAFGYIIGAGDESTSGTITVENGGSVYENLVITDLHGGGGIAAIVNGTTGKNDYGTFPFNQFYVQNIEPKMTLHSGATENAYYYIYAKADANGPVKFISASSDSFFGVSAGGSITKWYDYTTDRQCFEMRGGVSINAITVKISLGMTMTITSSNFILPIGNFDFTLMEGSSMTLTNNAEMLPGARITIAQGANLTIDKNLYLYDYSDWGYYCGSGYVRPISTPAGHKAGADARTPAGASTYYRMGQAELVIDGTVTIGASGQIYTTTGGANIYSHGTGQLIFSNAVPTAGASVYKIYGNYGRGASGSLTAEQAYNGQNIADGQTYIGKFGLLGNNYGAYGDAIPCTPAVLRNANGSVYQTAGKAAGTTVRYVNGYWKVLTYDNCLYRDELGHIYTFTDEDDFTEVIVSSTYTEAWEKVEASNLLFIHTADNCDWVKVNAVPEVASTTKLLKDPETNIYYQYNSTKGYWEEATSYTVTFKNYNGKVLQESSIYPGGVPAYKGLTSPVRPEDETGVYTFVGWKVNGEGETITSFSAVNANTTYIAQYDCTPNVATINSLGVISYYSTWASALAYANAQTTTPTLKLLGNVSGISSIQTISKSMTLDLNGHTLSGTVSEMLKVNSAITVTITDGSVGQTGVISSVGTATSSNYHTMSVAKGKVILENGTLKGKANGASVFPILINSDGTFEMLGGRITTDATGANNHGMLVKTKNTFIKGGTIDVPGAAVYISSGYSGTDKMTISGGYIKGGTIINSGNSADNRVNVTGGYFSTNVSLSSLVAAPYMVMDNVDPETKTTYPYEVGEGYKVTFKNGTIVLQEGYVKVGTTPAYAGANPTKDADAQYTYAFSGWSPTIEAVSTDDQVYAAQFDQTLRSYTIIFKNEDGTELQKSDVEYGVVPSYTGATPAKTATAEYSYTFKGWNTTPVAVTGAATYTATFNATKNKYTITFANIDGNGGTSEKEYEYGATPSYDGTPAKAEDATNTYEFTGWNKEFATVTEATTYTAQFTAHAKDLPLSEDINATGAVTITESKKVNNLTISETGSVTITDDAAVTVVNNLLLEATPDNNLGAVLSGNVQVQGDAYIDINMNGSGSMNKSYYYSFAVPFNVDINGGVFRMENGNAVPAKPNTEFRVWTYSESARATSTENAWVPKTSGTLEPGVFYLLQVATNNTNTYRFKWNKQGNLNNHANIENLSYTQAGSDESAASGWHGVANNGLGYAKMSGNFTYVQMLNSELNKFEGELASTYPVAIGNPVFVQLTAAGNIDMTASAPAAVAAAPRHVQANAENSIMTVQITKDGASRRDDQIFISASEDALDEYEAGKDLSKMFMGTAKVAQMWINAYENRLVANEAVMVNNRADFALTMFAPTAADYELNLRDIPSDVQVVLLQFGTPIADLTLMPYYTISLPQGETTDYSIAIIHQSPSVATGTEQTESAQKEVQKIFFGGKLYIVNGERVYNAQGKLVK